MMRYILDISQCVEKKWGEIFGEHTKIECVDGDHEKEFDAVMEALPDDVLEKIYADRRRAYKHLTDEQFNQMLEMPLGFSRDTMPEGAKLIEEKP